jgi:hypothetical protein
MRQTTLLSVWPEICARRFEYGSYKIPAGSDEKPATLVLQERETDNGIGLAFTKIPAGWDDETGMPKFFLRPISSEETARAISTEWGHVGVIVIAGDTPTQEEVKKSIEIKTIFYVRMVDEGDTFWTRFRLHGMISDLHRKSAAYLRATGHPKMHQPREWMQSEGLQHKMIDCPVCFEQIPALTVKCKHCGAILRREEAIKYGIFVPPEQVAPQPEAPPAEG